MAVDTFRYRMLAFVIASFFAGLAGALFAHYVGTVNPKLFDVEQMVYVLIWAIVGGTATFYGPIMGVVALTIINEIVLRGIGVDEMRPMFYGANLDPVGAVPAQGSGEPGAVRSGPGSRAKAGTAQGAERREA